MSDWIEQLAESINELERNEERQRQWQIHKSRVIQERWADAWYAVLSVIHDDVSGFNAKFADDPAKQIVIENQSDGRLQLRRDDKGTVRFVQMSGTPTGAQLRIRESSCQAEVRRLPKFETIPFDLSNVGTFGLVAGGRISTPREAPNTSFASCSSFTRLPDHRHSATQRTDYPTAGVAVPCGPQESPRAPSRSNG